ncbi:MAG: hypothetical protein K9K66_04865 [Desulfarculaceae bacterium]|nr:hypothetical protein [Desulfarculaceae bacterium]MCF8072803.1 hypothetical protein [Desulfarculaceae bacterium]MCF8100971.1 hypothetical protein [Desulfarculaceae bacterium]MCF8118535.1 hypothetical protein [Desulfarculaceae bacterium]
MGKKIRLNVLVLLLIFTFLTAMPAVASEESGWRFEFTPYVWLTGIDTDITVGRLSADVDVSFSDIWDNFDQVVALSGRFEAWHGDWGLIADGTYSKISTDQTVQTKGGGDITAKPDFKISFVEMAVAYEAYRSRGEGHPQVVIQPYLGGRYNYFNQELELQFPSQGTTRGTSDSWIDPMVGGRLEVLLSHAWRLGVRGDIGGFGISNCADLSWQLAVGVDWRFVDWASLKLGYQWYYTDYKNDSSGSDAFSFDGTLQGPWLGMTFYF